MAIAFFEKHSVDVFEMFDGLGFESVHELARKHVGVPEGDLLAA